MSPVSLARTLSVVGLALLPLAGAGQERLSPEAFERYATGLTLNYGVDGKIYGTEQYLPDRRVIWAFSGEECRRGRWFPVGDQVCFIYENDPTTHCWTFFVGDEGLIAQFENDPDASPLVEVDQSPEPLFCPGPDVGV